MSTFSKVFSRIGPTSVLVLFFSVSCSKSVQDNTQSSKNEKVNTLSASAEGKSSLDTGSKESKCKFPNTEFVKCNIDEKKENRCQCDIDWCADSKKIKSSECTVDTSSEKVCDLTLTVIDPKTGDNMVVYGFSDTPYALCSMAKIPMKDEYKSNNATAVFECPVYRPSTDVEGVSVAGTNIPPEGNTAFSNFSLANILDPKSKSINIPPVTICQYDSPQPFADCFGVACDVNTKTQKANCECPIIFESQPPQPFVVIGDECDIDTLYSAVSLDNFQLTGTYRIYDYFGYKFSK